MIGGCNGSHLWINYTDQIWVHPDYQNQGLGRELMKQVHDCGRTKGCSMATVVTMGFQGVKEFYEHLGCVWLV